jgi:hypothetical protein
MTRPGSAPATYRVMLYGDQLQISGIGPGTFPLSAQSETAFSLFSAYAVHVEVDFERDSQGAVTHLRVTGPVGGLQRAARVEAAP